MRPRGPARVLVAYKPYLVLCSHVDEAAARVDDQYTVNHFRLTGFQKQRRDKQAISASSVGDLLCQPPSDQWV